MLAYIFRRLLLIIPTLFGILLINFVIIQAAPGGPVEQMIAKLEGFEGATSRIAGGGAEVSVAGSAYRGAQGLDPALIKEIEHMYGFDKSAPERLWIMVKNYASLDFGDQGRVQALGTAVVGTGHGHLGAATGNAAGGAFEAFEFGDHLFHRAPGGGLNDDEVDDQDAEQGRDDQQQAAQNVGQHVSWPLPRALRSRQA